ncbi:MAG: hypothetical protein J6V53_05970 [Alphaproteobacteria bacterium]|nr:hypothetical protein [Alphaproteobacteria bacterium]
MKKILLLSTLFLLTNCKNITHQDYILDVNNQTKLPALEAVIDTTNLENVFSLGGFVANANNMGAAGRNGWVQASAMAGTSFRDPRMQDTMTLFDDFVKNKVTNPYGEKKGYMVLNIGYRNAIDHYENIATAWLSIISLGTLNLLGFPFGVDEDEMKISVEILNSKKELVKRYTSVQSDTEWAAAYWGYNVPKISRKITIENVKNALEDIGNQISNDVYEINKRLK